MDAETQPTPARQARRLIAWPAKSPANKCGELLAISQVTDRIRAMGNSDGRAFRSAVASRRPMIPSEMPRVGLNIGIIQSDFSSVDWSFSNDWSHPVPKLPATPQVSIVIPLQGNESLFEESLLSVLENEFGECQIIAVHNGTYSDTFDLSDEVDLVTARSSNLVDLLRDSVQAVRAPIVYFLSAGFRATEGWIDQMLSDLNDPQVGAVASQITMAERSGVPIPACWMDHAGRLCDPVSKFPRASTANRGFLLNAFAIRRSVLVNLLEAIAPALTDVIEVAYAMGSLMHRSGLTVRIAESSRVECCVDDLWYDGSDATRGSRLAAIRKHVLPDASALRVSAMAGAALFGASSVSEMFGMFRAAAEQPAIARSIGLLDVSPNTSEPAKSRASSLRRAA